MDGTTFALRFEDENNYVVRFPVSQQGTADELSEIGSRYGFLASGAGSEFVSLDERTDSLLDEFDARPLTAGVSESDLAADAATLASDWNAWIQEFGGESPEADLAQANRDLVSVIAEVSANPTDAGLDAYNAEIRRFNAAVRTYNQGL